VLAKKSKKKTGFMKNFLQNLEKDFSNLKMIKVAVLGDTTIQFLIQALGGWGSCIKKS
jgi:hypothetical protein